VPVWEVNERFALELPEADYDTLGGFILGHLGRIAAEGDEIATEGGRFRVIAMDGRRIDRIAFFPDSPRPGRRGE
jgi:CBS domain containing-hemolysin-like protein